MCQRRDDGIEVSGAKALLASIADVHGNTWTYDYYGQETGETDAALLNFLLASVTPSVDVDGDDIVDGSLTLKELTYAPAADLAVNGDMEADSDWTAISGAAPSTNEHSTDPDCGRHIQLESRRRYRRGY